VTPKKPNSGSDLLDSASLSLAEEFVYLSDAPRTAREDALIAGGTPISNGACATLAFFAKLLDAKAVVEVGAATAATALALFAGMNPKGILTTIDTEAVDQLEAKESVVAAGIPARQFRPIAGVALDVLPNLTDAAYDMVFINGDKLEYVEYVAQAIRLLRSGGIVIVNDVLWHNLVADPRNDDDETVIAREALQAVQDAEELTPLLIPLGQGLLVALRA
jgi:predicted O-methyltransferase YrrM